MPKVLFLTTVDTFFLSHRKVLAMALLAEGFSVVVAAVDTGSGDRIRALGARFVPLGLERGSVSPRREARTLAEIARLYRREAPDVVHHSSIKPMIYGSLAARVSGVPHVLNTVSGLGYALTETESPTLERRILRLAATTGYRVALRQRRCHNVFQNRDQLRSFVDAGLVVESRSSLVIGAGVDVERFVPTPLPPGPKLVVLPARMLSDKGIFELVAAARLVRAALGEPVRFALVGGEDPGNRAAIPRVQLDAWTSEGIVEWWGHRADMPEVLARSHLVVLPSYAEGMPLALAEAAAAGRAIVTTDVPGCREAVVAGESGLLVPPRDARALADAIARLLADDAALRQMGERGRRHAVAVLSRERVIEGTFAVLRTMGVPWPAPLTP